MHRLSTYKRTKQRHLSHKTQIQQIINSSQLHSQHKQIIKTQPNNHNTSQFMHTDFYHKPNARNKYFKDLIDIYIINGKQNTTITNLKPNNRNQHQEHHQRPFSAAYLNNTIYSKPQIPQRALISKNLIYSRKDQPQRCQSKLLFFSRTRKIRSSKIVIKRQNNNPQTDSNISDNSQIIVQNWEPRKQQFPSTIKISSNNRYCKFVHQIHSQNKIQTYSTDSLNSLCKLSKINIADITEHQNRYRFIETILKIINQNNQTNQNSKLIFQSAVENEDYQIFTFGTFEKHKLFHVKRYKNTSRSDKFMNIFEKVRQKGLSNFWSKATGVLGQEQNVYFSYGHRTLRQELMSIQKVQKYDDNDNPLYKIVPREQYYRLFDDNCAQLSDIIIGVAYELQKMSATFINNKISMDNIYRLDQKCFKIGDWGCSAVQNNVTVGGKEMSLKQNPIITNNNDENSYMLRPENLPPEVLLSLLKGSYIDVWEKSQCPQIWSLGIIIYEILTLIPVWMPHLTIVGKKIPKRGVFHDHRTRLTQIYASQCKLPAQVTKMLRNIKDNPILKQTHPKIIELMKQILQIDPSLRPTPRQIINKLTQF